MHSRKGPPPDVDREFADFFAAQTPLLMRTAWVLTGDPSAAEELVQSVLARAYARWSRIRECDAPAYVRRMLVNARTDRWRARRREQLVALVPEHATADAGHRTVDDRDQLVRALAGLSGRQRQMLVLRYFHDLSNEQIAVDLGVSVSTVKSTLSRGLTQLRADGPSIAVANGRND